MNEMDSHVRPSDGKQKPPIAGKDFGETRTGGAPDNDSPRSQIKNDGKNQQIPDENPFVYVNNALKQIQQVKSTLLEGLGKSKEMERSLLQYFHEEFEKFSTAAQDMSQRLLEKNLEGAEDLFGNLFNENEFADLFVKHCDLYLAGRTTWNEFQKPFEPYLKKPQGLKNNNGDASTIGEYVSIRMQPNMLASDLTGGKPVVPKTQKTENNKENQMDRNRKDDHHDDDGDQPEVTIKRNVDFTADNQAQSDFSKEKEKSNIHENLPAGQKAFVPPYQKSDENSKIKPLGQDSGKRTLRSAVSSNEVSKYKFQYKSRANFSRLTNSNSQSNLSAFDNNNASQPPISRFSAINNGNGDKSIEELSSKLKDTLQLLNEIKEQRDSYKERYNQAQVQLLELQSQLSSSNQLPK